MTDLSPLARRSAAALGLLALATLVLQYALMVQTFAAMGQGPLAALWRFLGYFTLLTNCWVGIAMLAVAAGRNVSPRTLTALTLSILLVGTVYHLLLSATHHPVGWDWVANLGAHTLVPAFTLLWWLAFVDRARLSFADIPVFTIWPFGYAVYALARGAVDGWYAYFFIDVPSLGYPQTLLNILFLGLGFAAAGALFVAAGRYSGRRASA